MSLASALALYAGESKRGLLLAIKNAGAASEKVNSLHLLGIILDKEIFHALLLLLHPSARHGRTWDTLEVRDCASNQHLDSLMKFVYHCKLFRNVSFISESHQFHKNPPPTARMIHPALQVFTISNAFISISDAVLLRYGLESSLCLRTLSLKSIQFERCAICQIAQGVESSATLQTLDCDFLSSVDAYVLLHSVSGHPTILEMTFTGDCIPDSAGVFLAKGLNKPDCPLRALSLNGLGVFDLEQATNSVHLPSYCRLQRLDLADNSLQNYQIDHLLCNLRKFHMLETLDLSRNCLTGDFVGALEDANVSLSDSLKCLNLSHNRLTDFDADEFLVNLWKFPRLRELDLSFNRLTKLEFKRFFSNPFVGELGRLALFHTHFALLNSGEDFSDNLLRLLQKTSNHLKIGSFWSCRYVETRHFLDIRQIWIRNPDETPFSLWPLVISRSNQIFERDENRQANAIYWLVKGPACQSFAFAGAQTNERARTSADDEGTDADADAEAMHPGLPRSGSGGSIPTKESLENLVDTMATNNRTIRELIDKIPTGEASSEFMTCSMDESETTDRSTIEPQARIRPPTVAGRPRRSRYFRLFRFKRGTGKLGG